MSTIISKPLRAELLRAAVLGMSQEARDAGLQVDRRLGSGPLTMLGAPGPHRALLDRARRHGALEGDLNDASAPTRRVMVPMTGASAEQRQGWRAKGHELVDLTLPSVRRLHAMKSLLASELRHLVLVGFRGDPECEALVGGNERVTVVENADEVVRLPFSPRFGLLCQTSVASRRFATVAAALRMRHPDSDVQALDTRSPAMIRREDAMADLTRRCDAVLVLADLADLSGTTLYEVARCHGKPAARIGSPDTAIPLDLTEYRRIGLTAGVHTPDAELEALEARLRGG
ncbi:hypothetical protein [Haloferula helveola]